MDTEFIDVPDDHRYELRSGDQLVGFIDYRLHGDVIRLVHTEVPPAFSGQGHAATLARSALDDARATLGEQAWQKARDEGTALDFDAALRLALDP